MVELSTIGLDIAKGVFQVHGVDGNGAVVVRRQSRRAELLKFFGSLQRFTVGVEAYATSHHRIGATNHIYPLTQYFRPAASPPGGVP